MPRLAAAPQAAGDEPTDEKLTEHVRWFADERCWDEDSGDIADSCRELIVRWGRPALRPVPVSERLPEAGDCAQWDADASGDPNWCWVGAFANDEWVWRRRSPAILPLFPGIYTHWLPAHALPVPEVTE